MGPESQTARALDTGVSRVVCDLDRNVTGASPTYTLLITCATGEGLVARGKYDHFRIALARLRRRGVPCPSGFPGARCSRNRAGSGLSELELEARRLGLETFFSKLYGSFGDLSLDHRDALARSLALSHLTPEAAEQLDDLILHGQDDDDDDEETLGGESERDFIINGTGRGNIHREVAEPKVQSKTASSRQQRQQHQIRRPLAVELTPRSLLATSPYPRASVEVEATEDDALYSLRISCAAQRVALVFAHRRFEQFQSLKDAAERLSKKDTIIKALRGGELPAFPEKRAASQRLGFRATPAQLEARRSDLQRYCATIIAAWPELDDDSRDLLLDALDGMDVEPFVSSNSGGSPYAPGGKARAGAKIRPVDDADLDVEAAAKYDAEFKRSTSLAGIAKRRRKVRLRPPLVEADGGVRESKRDEPFFDDDDDDDDDLGEAPTGGPFPDVKGDDLDDAAPKYTPTILPKCIEVATKLRAAELCLAFRLESISNVASLSFGEVASSEGGSKNNGKNKALYVSVKVVEDDDAESPTVPALLDDKLAPLAAGRLRARSERAPPRTARYSPTHAKTGDACVWSPPAPLFVSLDDADDGDWAKRRLVFELYDAALVSKGKERDNALRTRLPPQKGSDSSSLPYEDDERYDYEDQDDGFDDDDDDDDASDEPAAMIAYGEVRGLREFEFAGLDDDEDEEPQVTRIHVDLIDADNRIVGAQLHGDVTLTASSVAADYLSVSTVALVKYEKYVGAKFKANSSATAPYSLLCQFCLPSFLLDAADSSKSSTGGKNDDAPSNVRRNDDDDSRDWELVGYFRAPDFRNPWLDAPTKFDLVRADVVGAHATLDDVLGGPLDPSDEVVLENWRLRAPPSSRSAAFEYAHSYAAKLWGPLHTASNPIRRSAWYRISKKANATPFPDTYDSLLTDDIASTSSTTRRLVAGFSRPTRAVARLAFGASPGGFQRDTNASSQRGATILERPL